MQDDHAHLIWLVVECLLIYEGVRRIDRALGDGHVQRLGKVSTLAGAVCGIIAGARAPARATAYSTEARYSCHAQQTIIHPRS